MNAATCCLDGNETDPRCRPILTPKTVLPIFFAVGIIFAPIGGLLLWASTTVRKEQACVAELASDTKARSKNWSLTIPIARLSVKIS